jgi:hypothetical protein
MTLAKATAANGSFSKQTPGLQVAIDSTSLGEAKQCLRKYYYSIVLGYQPRTESVHLTFGLLLHGSREHYDHARSAGHDHDESLRRALSWALCQTWNKELSRPWASDHRTKNRLTLIRSIVWYFDQFGENDPLVTVQLTNGKPAVELSFRFDLGHQTRTGERYLYCGHLDRLVTMGGDHYVVDLKTTEHALDPSWFGKFTPGGQFSGYVYAGRVCFQTPTKGLIVDGLQVGAGFTRCTRGLVPRDDAMLAEWHRDTGRWLRVMEEAAQEGLLAEEAGEDPVQGWPMNDKACDMYGGCQFRPVCSRTPSARHQWLEADYKRRVWDPTVRRGDI